MGQLPLEKKGKKVTCVEVISYSEGEHVAHPVDPRRARFDLAKKSREHHVAADENEPERGTQEIILQHFDGHQQHRLHQHQEHPSEEKVVHKALSVRIQVRQPVEDAVIRSQNLK